MLSVTNTYTVGDSRPLWRFGSIPLTIVSHRFVCIDNNNFEVAEAETPPEPQTCVECYEEFLTQEQIDLLFPVSSIEEACDDSVGVILNEVLFRQIVGVAETITGEDIDIEALIDCLERAGLVFGENPPT